MQDRLEVLETAGRKNDVFMTNAAKFLQAAIGNPVSLGNLDRETLGMKTVRVPSGQKCFYWPILD
jgi:hypothetical protein